MSENVTDRIDWDELVEALAPLEHQQWREWSEELAESEDLSQERIDRWEEYWVPYKDLPEEVKDHDREWAEEAVWTLHRRIKQMEELSQDTGVDQ